MGASFDYRIIEVDTFQEALKKFKEYQEDDRYENGHSYSGGIGMCPGVTNRDKVFASRQDAHDWVQDNVKKWDDALAVQFIDEEGKPAWFIGGLCSS